MSLSAGLLLPVLNYCVTYIWYMYIILSTEQPASCIAGNFGEPKDVMQRKNTYLELSFLCHSCVSLCSIKDRGWLVIRYHNLIDMFVVKRSVINDNRLSK